ncbi:hypothetical protein [Silvanigrella sp.]|jgi:hypothetical protein|uniref:hypothetical protein n=1 Tax=Silvanigrella sp. TaxID=2024976 RepID=UPI0037C76950
MSYFCKPKHVSQKTINDKLYIYAPFNLSANKKYKTRGGNWNASLRAWEFNSLDSDKVNKLLDSIFGENGTENEIEYVSLKLKGERLCGNYADFVLTGRKIVERKERNSEVSLDSQAILLNGVYDRSGGSVANPKITGKDVQLLLRYFPKKLIESIKKDFENENLELEIDEEDTKKISDSMNKTAQEKHVIAKNENENFEEKYNKLLIEHNALLNKMNEIKSLINTF